jgi:hypothetical protein
VQREAAGPDPADEFDRIVADWRREKSIPAWPDDAADTDVRPRRGSDADTADIADTPADTADTPADTPADTGCERRDEPGGESDAAHEHFVPAEPPPLPPVGPPAIVGLGLLLLGLVLVGAPWWIGIPDAYGLPLGLVTLAAGLGWLVLRLWPDPPARGDGEGRDDGAVL